MVKSQNVIFNTYFQLIHTLYILNLWENDIFWSFLIFNSHIPSMMFKYQLKKKKEEEVYMCIVET